MHRTEKRFLPPPTAERDTKNSVHALFFPYKEFGRRKTILFRKNGVDIPIDALSSGEKQIVYRGCFLLKDVNAISGAFVFIDEPEISLHPVWQTKIMDYYKSIFTDESERLFFQP